MKITISSLVLIFVVQIAFAQETVQIKTGSKKTYFTEIYNVLKSNKNIKQGQYQKFVKDTQLKVDGFYKLDQKDSLWTEYDFDGSIESQGHYKNDKKVGKWTEYEGYSKTSGSYTSGIKNGLWETLHYNGNQLRNKGNYTDDIKTGVWEFYNTDGSLLQKYDFDSRELLYDAVKDIDSLKVEMLTDSGYISVYVDRPVKLIGGPAELSSLLYSNVNYPEVAMDNGIEGTVIVDFIVNEQGIASDFNVEKPKGGGLDRESIRVLKLISNNWIPAIYNGRPVTVKINVPIRFKLNR